MDPTELHQVAELCEQVAAVAGQLAEARARVAELAAERRRLLGLLRGRGLSVTQVAELTGLSRGQVANEMARSQAQAPVGMTTRSGPTALARSGPTRDVFTLAPDMARPSGHRVGVVPR